ncbi:MAG: exo-alpha-sialidase, partial [Verrucomicrobiae bacterium]|nr:exo-alpha-sialidase [Verrucomicrobiae bacterium]
RKSSRGDWGPIDIMMRRSADGGKTWLPRHCIVRVEEELPVNPVAAAQKLDKPGDNTANNPVAIADLETGAVHFLYCLEYMRCFYMRSDDEGATWSQPVEITATFERFRKDYDWKVIATGPGHGIQLTHGPHKGRLIVPVWLSLGTGGHAHRPSVASTIYSDDHGRTWHRGEIAFPDIPPYRYPSETVAIQLADGRVMLNARSESDAHRRLVSVSPDGATRWSTPRFDDALLEPICMASMVRLDSERILFANPHNLSRRDKKEMPGKPRDRLNLSIKLSLDDGQTWPISKLLQAGPSGYSDLAVTKDGTILCFYEAGEKGPYEKLRLARFNLEWLTTIETPLEFIDTSFENASPLWYEVGTDGTIFVNLIYDHERSSPNRAAGHIHFLLSAKPGAKLVLEFRNLENVWNARPSSVAKELKTVVVSEDGKSWRAVPTEVLPGNRVRLTVDMPGPRLYVARVEPYRISDLERLLKSIRKHRLVEVTPIGKTVAGRELEIIRVGNPNAAHRVFIRARAHPWESGGNWVVEGFIRQLLKESNPNRFCAYILPMANKDGVARGMTRFNLLGKDLNRNWDKPADPQLAPENAALEKWLDAMIKTGRRPHLALDFHNDGSGRLHISRPSVPQLERYLERMRTLEALLRKHTWFTEGSTQASFRNPGTLGDGWLERFGIDAVVHEFNCNWIAGINDYPLGRHWLVYGEKLVAVFDEYFKIVNP